MFVPIYCGFCGEPLTADLQECPYCKNLMCERCVEEHRRACYKAPANASLAAPDEASGFDRKQAFQNVR